MGAAPLPPRYGNLLVGVYVGPRPVKPAGYEARGRNFGARIDVLKPRRKSAHHAKPGRPGVVVCLAEMIFPTQEQINRYVISAFVVGELCEPAQDAL
jgi:hypothetical protein